VCLTWLVSSRSFLISTDYSYNSDRNSTSQEWINMRFLRWDCILWLWSLTECRIVLRQHPNICCLMQLFTAEFYHYTYSKYSIYTLHDITNYEHVKSATCLFIQLCQSMQVHKCYNLKSVEMHTSTCIL